MLTVFKYKILGVLIELRRVLKVAVLEDSAPA